MSIKIMTRGSTVAQNKVMFHPIAAEKQKMPRGKLKPVLFFVVGLMLVVGNFLFEANITSEGIGTASVITVFDYSKVNYVPENGLMRFDNEITPSVDVLASEGNEYIFKMDSGHVWGNFAFSNASVNILVDNAVIIPNDSKFDLKFDGETIQLVVYEGDSFVGFLEDGVTLPKYADEYSSIFMNKLLVPQGAQATIPVRKIDDRLGTLLHSKLIKEFKYRTISDEQKNDVWVKQNIQEDSKYEESVLQRTLSNILHEGTQVHEGLIGGTVSWVSKNLTFFAEKKAERSLDQIFAYIDDAALYAGKGDEVQVQSNLNSFEQSIISIPTAITASEEYKKALDERIEKFSIFGPGDASYKVLLFLLDQKFYNGDDQFGVVNTLWRDVYDAMELNVDQAFDAMDVYYNHASSVMGRYEDYDYYNSYINYQNQLFDNLFLRYDWFYKDDYFEMKYNFEEELMSLYEEGQLRQEIAQSFIDNKIYYLKRLKLLFFEEKIEVAEARNIVSRLIKEVDALMPSEGTNLAVLKLFEDRMEDISSFWGYLNSPEYYSSAAYGTTHEMRYESYLNERDKIWSFIDIQQDVLGGDSETEISVNDVRQDIREFFESNEDVEEFEIGEITDVSQRYVDVEAVMGGYTFEAVFDREYESVKDVYVYDQLITDSAVKLDGLLSLLEKHFTVAGEEIVPETDVDEETNAQRIRRRYVANLLTEGGFVVSEDDLELIDDETGTYVIGKTYLEEYRDVDISFEYVANTEKLRNIYVVIEGKKSALIGEKDLDEAVEGIVDKINSGGKVGR